MSQRDISDLIERLGKFEERAGVRIEAVSAFLDDTFDDPLVKVLGEIHPAKGDKLTHHVELSAAIYDSRGLLVARDITAFDSNDVFGFGAVDFEVFIPKVDISKVQLVPRIIQEPY